MSALPDPRPDREPDSVRLQREAQERALRRASGAPVPPPAKPAPQTDPTPAAPQEQALSNSWDVEPEPLPKREVKPPVTGTAFAPPIELTTATERLGIECDGFQLEVQVHHICVNEYNIAFSFDPKSMRFLLKYEKELWITYRSDRFKVIYAGGLITFPNWPLHILSFMRLQETEKP